MSWVHIRGNKTGFISTHGTHTSFIFMKAERKSNINMVEMFMKIYHLVRNKMLINLKTVVHLIGVTELSVHLSET